MEEKRILDYAALQEWQADIISYEARGQVFFLQTTRGGRLLHIVSEQEAMSALARSRHLLKKGFKSAPRLLCNRFGEYIVQAFNGWYYITDMPCGKPIDYANGTVVQVAASCLGRFHHASKEYQSDLPMMGFAGVRLGRKLLRYRCFSCLSQQMEQDIAYLLQSIATALAGFSRQKAAKLQKLYRKQGGINLGGKISSLRIRQEEVLLTDISACGSGGGICDLSELLLQTAKAEHYALDNSLLALKSYNRENRLEKEELDLLFAALLLPVNALAVLNAYLRGESEYQAMQERFAAACLEEKEKNRWAKRLLM